MQPSQKLAVFLEAWEGFRQIPYKDSAGLWTCGIGHQMSASHPKQARWSKDRVMETFHIDLEAKSTEVNKCVRVLLEQWEFDALVSLEFNIGHERFNRSTVLLLTNLDKKADAAEWFVPWNKVTINGVKFEKPGLTKRRLAERAIYVNADYGGRP